MLNYYIENAFFINEIEKCLISILKISKTKKYFWHTKHYIEYLTDIYDKENDHDKLMSLLEEYSYDEDVYLKLVDEYLKQDETKEAIKLLENKMNDSYARLFARKLTDIYHTENMTKEYKDILYKLFYELDKYDIDVYKSIKKLYSEKEWSIEKKKIIKRVLKDSNSYFRNIINIYRKKMYDEIFVLVKDYNIDTIIYYEKYLLPKYNKELINIYANYCKNFARMASNKSLYKQLASYLRHIKNMQNSKEQYQKLMVEMREQYKNRSAMQDELIGL